MTTPPDVIAANLTPNPGDPAGRRSRAEEERLQKAIAAIIVAEANRLGIQASTDPGLIDPTAALNEERSQNVKEETNPKLLQFSRTVGASIKAEELRTPDGYLVKGLDVRRGSQMSLSVNLKELSDLGNRALDMAADLKTSLVGIAVKVGRFLISRIPRQGGELDTSESGVLVEPERFEDTEDRGLPDAETGGD